MYLRTFVQCLVLIKFHETLICWDRIAVHPQAENAVTLVQLGPIGRVTLGQRQKVALPMWSIRIGLNHIFSLRMRTDIAPETLCFTSLLFNTRRWVKSMMYLVYGFRWIQSTPPCSFNTSHVVSTTYLLCGTIVCCHLRQGVIFYVICGH